MWPPSHDLVIELLIQYLEVREAMKLRLLNFHLNDLVRKKCHLLKLTAPTVDIGQNRQFAPADALSRCPSLPYILLFLSHHDILRLKLVNRRICDLIRRNFHRLPTERNSRTTHRIMLGEPVRCGYCIFKGTWDEQENVRVRNRDYKIDGMAAGLRMILTLICKFSDVTSLRIIDNPSPLPEDCLRAILNVFQATRTQVRCLELTRMFDGFRSFSEQLDCRLFTLPSDLDLVDSLLLLHNFDLPLRMTIEQDQIKSILPIVDFVREWERGATHIRYLQLTFQEISHDLLPCSNAEAAVAFSSFDCFSVNMKENEVEVLIRRSLEQSILCLQYCNVLPFIRYVKLFEIPDISQCAKFIETYERSMKFLFYFAKKEWY